MSLETPNRWPLPPLLLAGVLIGAMLMRHQLPEAQVGWGSRILGGVFILAGLGLIFGAVHAFRTSGSNILPNRPASQLLTSGVFRISRNPIYTGEVIGIAGLGIATGTSSFLVGAAVLALLVLFFGILREEAHLAAKFGDEWQAYARRVRRWI
jgi:protein-S-isoprenylcysteine O-methyltransferase Ste14